MAPLEWPRPPMMTTIPAVAAPHAARSYVQKVRRHMESLQHTNTRYGILIGVMLSALEDAAKVFEVVQAAAGTDLAVHNEIDRINGVIQSLGVFMETDPLGAHDQDSEATEVQYDHASTKAGYTSGAMDSSESAVAASLVMGDHSQDSRLAMESEAEQEGRLVEIKILDEGTAIDKLISTGPNELKTRLLQDFQEQGIRIPVFFCSVSQDRMFVRIITSKKLNAAILRNSSFWEPTLFGENAVVTKPSLEQIKDLLSTDGPKMQKVEEKARKNAKVAWIVIPDREFAQLHLMSGDLLSRVKEDLKAQGINVRIEKCRKSRACRHIRLWTANSKDVFILTDQWEPTMFGQGAYVRWMSNKAHLNTKSTLLSWAPLEDDEGSSDYF